MHAVLLTVHALIVLALIVVVLLQRSDGGALGLGGGGGGGFMTSRGAANVLTRTTSVLAALFFATSLALAITAGGAEKDTDIIEDLTGQKVADPTAPVTTKDLLDTLGTGAAPPVEGTQSPLPTTAETPPPSEPSSAPAEEPPADETQPDAPQP